MEKIIIGYFAMANLLVYDYEEDKTSIRSKPFIRKGNAINWLIREHNLYSKTSEYRMKDGWYRANSRFMLYAVYNDQTSDIVFSLNTNDFASEYANPAMYKKVTEKMNYLASINQDC